jgi:phage head maturation protease
MFECLLAKLGSNAPRADLEAGVLANVSIGYSLGKMRKLPAGSDGIPIMQVEEYKIKEISLVGIGADEGAQVRKYDCEVRQ